MEKRIEEVLERKKNGFNCAQSVACTFSDLTDLDEDTIYSFTQVFGGGMGNMEGICGAVAGACSVLGLMFNGEEKMKAVKGSRYIMDNFKKRNSSVICKELKGKGTGVVLRSCDECVRDAAEMLTEYLNTVQK